MDAGEQAAERRLAGTGRTDDGDPLAGLEVELDPVQHVAAGDVGVAHVVGAQPVVVGLLAGRLAVGRNVGDADEPGERRPADLNLVEPREQPVDRIGELLDVEHDRRHLADRGVAGGDEVAAPRERRDDGQDVGDVDGREPDRPQPEREALRAVGVGQVRVDPAGALAGEAERLDGAAAVDRLAGRARERRVRGALPQVAGRGVAEVPARARRSGSAPRRCTGSAAIGLTQTAAPTTRSAVTHAIDVSGIANRIVRASASTSAVVRETRSPIPARSTVESGSARTRRMKSSRSSANICSERTNEARRAKNVRIVCATRKTARITTTRSIWAVSIPVWSPCTSEPRSGGPTRPGRGGEGVQDEDADHRAAVATRERRRLAAHLGGARDRAGACSRRLPPGDDVAVGGARPEQLPMRPASPARARPR